MHSDNHPYHGNLKHLVGMFVDVGCIVAPMSMHRSDTAKDAVLYLYRFVTGGYILFQAHRQGAFSLKYNSKIDSMLRSTSLMFNQSESLTSKDILNLIEYFSSIDTISPPSIASKFHHSIC